MTRDDRDDPFDDFFAEIERMMNEMMGDAGQFRIQGPGRAGGPGAGGVGGGDDVHVDVHEGESELRVVADLPGASKDEIGLKCDGTVLTIDAGGPDRNYHQRVRLPSRVDEHSAEASYNNGVLEVTFDRADQSTSIGLE